MAVIVPAILPESFDDLKTKLDALEGITDAVQIDIVDGKFASPASWPYAGGSQEFAKLAAGGEFLPHVDRMALEIDLMVTDPEAVTGMWLSLGAKRLTIHAESTSFLPRVISDLQVKYGHDKDFAPDLLSFGIAIHIESELSLIEPFLKQIDYVQFMGIDVVGRQGVPFDRKVLQKMAMFRRQHPEIPIQVDGGVSLANAGDLLSAGASRLIVGSDLWKAPNLKEEYQKLAKLGQEYGLYN